MSKIVQAVNAMIERRKKIGPVVPGENELFFLYDGKYKWSMRREDDGEHSLWYYPGEQELDQLANFDANDWDGFNEMVRYSDREIGTREAKASFAELYTLLREKQYGIDEVLDSIIEDIPF